MQMTRFKPKEEATALARSVSFSSGSELDELEEDFFLSFFFFSFSFFFHFLFISLTILCMLLRPPHCQSTTEFT